MGTSGAFGGSQTASWKDVAEHLQDEDEVKDDGVTDGESDSGADAPGAKLAALVAKALQGDDSSLKPRNAPASQDGDSGLLFGALVGNPRQTGTTRSIAGGRRRQITASVGRAGRAVGAGYALSSGNASALAEYGLELSTLSAMSKIDQIFAVMEAVEVDNSGPSDIALRGALYDVLDRILGVDDQASPVETLRELVGEYAIQLFAIEVDALIQDGALQAERRSECLGELSQVIQFDASRLHVDAAVLTTPRQFSHAAQQLMRATLSILRENDIQ